LSSNLTGYFNCAVGNTALEKNTGGEFNTAVGLTALGNNLSGYENTAMGNAALLFNQNGSYNVAIGSAALYNNLNHSNTALGYYTLFATTNSQYNTAVGYNAARTYDMGYNNTILGANCDVTGAGFYNCVAIGQAVTCTGSSQARIGNAATVSIGGYAPWSNISDGRFKKNVSEDVKGIDFIMKLRPVKYQLDVQGISNFLNESREQETNAAMQQAIREKEKMTLSGFIAQDVEAAARAVGYDFSGVDAPKNAKDLYSLRYSDFVVPLTKAVQEQQLIITKQQETINSLQERLKMLEEQVKLIVGARGQK
jgi:hypothetical protein